MLPTFWWWAAHPLAPAITGIVLLAWLIRLGFHKDKHGKITRPRCASVFGLAMSTHVFFVCALSEIGGGPSLHEIIKEGFGSGRVAIIFLVLTVDQIFRIWEQFEAEPEQSPE